MIKLYFTTLFLLFAVWNAQSQIVLSADTGTCGAATATLHAAMTGYTPTSSGITTDDIYSGVISMGMSFNFYGTSNSQVLIGANGTLCFTLSLAGASDPWPITAVLLGNASKRNNICGPWCDIDITNGGSITYATVGTAPYRKFIVNYCATHMFSCTSQYTTTQIVLYETTNLIDVFISYKTICSGWNGGYAICGVQNAAGTAATVAPSRDFPTAWTAVHEAWHFTPSSSFASYSVGAVPFSPVPLASSAIYWYDSTTGAYLGTGDSMVVSTAGSHTFKAVALGCGDSTFAFISVIASGSVPPITGPTAVCVGNTISLGNTATGGTWTSSATSVASVGASTGTVTGVSAGTAVITYTVAGGCYDTSLVTVNPLPATIGGPTVVCVGSTITLTNSASGGTWSTASGSAATVSSSSGVLTGVSAGTVTVTYTLPTGCYVTTSITVNPLPNAGTLSGSATVCLSASTTLSSTVTGGTWSSASTGIASISSTGVVYGIATGTAVISYSVTNSCGTAVATFSITVLPLPDAGTLSGPATVCVYQSITLSATVSGGTWTSGSSTIAVVSSGVVTGVSAGTVSISYAYTNACGTAYTTHTITVNPVPTVTGNPSAPAYCTGGDTVLIAGGAVNYTWAPGTALSTTTGTTVTANPSATTTYTITGTDANGCANTAAITVTVNPLPTITIPTATICYGTNTILIASGANTYTWTPAGTLSSSAGSSVIATPTDSTSYTVTGTDINGCVNTGIATVYVNPIPAAPLVTSPVSYCLMGTSAALTAAGTGLLWYTTTSGGTGSTAAPIPSTAAAGTTFWYVTQTINGCESPRAAIKVDVLPNAITDFDYSIKYGCARDTVEFINLSQNCDSFTWHFGDGDVSHDTRSNFVHYYPSAEFNQNYTVKLNGINFSCNDDSTFKTITLVATPPVYFLTGVTASQTITYGASIQLNAMGGHVYYWTPNDGTLNNPNINNPVASPRDSTRYIVYSYNEEGCRDSAIVDINVTFNDHDNYPLAFSPNNDGKNDVFHITQYKYEKLVEFNIYNRWGELVFHTTDKTKGWDGHHNGEPQDMGVYFYEVISGHTDGTNQTHKGSVTLIR
ncbi:MAG: gliding motility-associated C-terminal domain-containing protein [Taibaiella sp.]|nr:gliding motility-associated C-terminal domain-containing protein [Taibaiella sp.]